VASVLTCEEGIRDFQSDVRELIFLAFVLFYDEVITELVEMIIEISAIAYLDRSAEIGPDVFGNEVFGNSSDEESTGENVHRPTWSFSTSDCRETYETLRTRGVEFFSEPVERPYGVEARFYDLYGHPFVLVEDTLLDNAANDLG
jgi:hypothetical protein